MPSLIIHVVHPDDGSRRSYTFDRSPVRVGRSPLNDLPLAFSTVSHCHGVLHFHGSECQYLDLGSTNGSALNGQPLPRNTAFSLPMPAILTLGAVRLELKLEAGRVSGTRESYAFDRQSLLAEAGARPDGQPPGACSAEQETDPLQDHAPGRTVADQLAPAYRDYRAAWAALLRQVQRHVDTRDLTQRQTLLPGLLEHCPALAQESEFRQLFGTDASLAQRRAPVPPAVSAAGLPERAQALIERFVRTFVELRRGREQLLKQLGLGGLGDDSALRECGHDPDRLMAFLLDPSQGERPLDALARAYADIMLHEVAFLSAVTAGARELVDSFEPQSLGRPRRGVTGWLLSLLGRDGRWRVLEQRFRDLQEEGTLASMLFGRAFRRTYHGVFGAQEPRGSAADSSLRRSK